MSQQVSILYSKLNEKYTGDQLSPLHNYLKHNLIGSSIVGFRGPCQVSFEKMLDGEDLKAKSQICGSDMIHFVGEFFHMDLLSGVFIQRLMAAIISDSVYTLTDKKDYLRRSGDDLYSQDKKFSISIASPAVNSVLVHFAVNVSTQGTPVPTIGLNDLKIDPEIWAERILEKFKEEIEDSLAATYKVRAAKPT